MPGRVESAVSRVSRVSINQDLLERRLQASGLFPELSPGPRIPRCQIHAFDQLGSTNQTLWQLIGQGTVEGTVKGSIEGTIEGTVAIAAQQQSGRGQWGRQWQSPLGGLYLSMALMPDVAAAHSAQLTLATAWGIATALRQRDLPVLLKWPNDLVIAQDTPPAARAPATRHLYKLGGILTETKIQQGQISKAVVGVGINWRNPVPETATTLEQWLPPHRRGAIACLEDVAAIAIEGIVTGYRHWLDHGIDDLLPRYQALLAHLHTRLPLAGDSTQPGGTGLITGVTATGALNVRLVDDRPTATSGASGVRPTDIQIAPGEISLGYAIALP